MVLPSLRTIHQHLLLLSYGRTIRSNPAFRDENIPSVKLPLYKAISDAVSG
jgi:hypothetical protein